MHSDKPKTELKPRQTVFPKRLDLYWQFIAIYFIVLLVYALLKGSLEDGTLSIRLNDPVVILLLLFALVTSFYLIIAKYRKALIIINDDFIIFRSRFAERKYTRQDIVRIAIGKERIMNMKSAFMLIKMQVQNRRRTIRFRPSSFYFEKDLVSAIISLKKNLNK